jgi:hypothetical protein
MWGVILEVDEDRVKTRRVEDGQERSCRRGGVLILAREDERGRGKSRGERRIFVYMTTVETERLTR